jgi:hypothetical protein
LNTLVVLHKKKRGCKPLSFSSDVKETPIRITDVRVISQLINLEPNALSGCLSGGWFVNRSSLFVHKHVTGTTSQSCVFKNRLPKIRPDFDVLTTNLIFEVGVNGSSRFESVYFLTVVENLKETLSEIF